jgi:hypothetical protein
VEEVGLKTPSYPYWPPIKARAQQMLSEWSADLPGDDSDFHTSITIVFAADEGTRLTGKCASHSPLIVD